MADAVQDTCHHEFEGTDTCRWCGLVTTFTPEQEALIERVAAALVTPSRTDRQPPASSSETKGGETPVEVIDSPTA